MPSLRAAFKRRCQSTTSPSLRASTGILNPSSLMDLHILWTAASFLRGLRGYGTSRSIDQSSMLYVVVVVTCTFPSTDVVYIGQTAASSGAARRCCQRSLLRRQSTNPFGGPRGNLRWQDPARNPDWKSGADSSHGTLLLTLTSDGRLDGTWTGANGVSGPWTMARQP
jgi:hypothetical protein